MENLKRFLAAIIPAAFATLTVYGQVDPHFSQFYALPMYLNPAMAGTYGGTRASLAHRSQWTDFGSGYKTTSLSADAPIDAGFSVGGSYYNQQAGDAGYTYQNAYAAGAFNGIAFGTEGYQRISLGLGLGWIGLGIDPTKFTLQEQWDPVRGYQPLHQNAEYFNTKSANVMDLSVGGLYYDTDPKKTANLFLGFSAWHINGPNDPFLNAEDGSPASKIPARLAFNVGMSYRLSDFATLVPSVLYQRQGQARELTLAGYCQIEANFETDVIFGLNFRNNDAIAPIVGLSYRDFDLGMSYDLTTSSLNGVSPGASSFEVTIAYHKRDRNNETAYYLHCPKM